MAELRGWRTSIQPLQGRDAVVFLKRLRFLLDLGGVELDLFWIFFGLDLDESAIEGLFHRFSQIVERFNFFAVYFVHGEISKLVVPDCAVRRQYLAEDDDAAIALRKKFRLKTIHINQALRRFPHPISSPFLQILPGEFLENETAEHEIRWRLIGVVGRTGVILWRAMLQGHIQLHRLVLALNLKRHDVTGVGMRGEQIRKFDLAVKRIDIVAGLIDFVISNRSDDVAYVQSGFHRRHVGFDVRNVNARRLAGLTGKLSQLRVARREK